jgi:hypothetical protein
MIVGDLVKVSMRGYTGIGYVKGFGQFGNSYVLVRYISGSGYFSATEGFFPREKLTLLKEVLNENR